VVPKKKTFFKLDVILIIFPKGGPKKKKTFFKLDVILIIFPKE